MQDDTTPSLYFLEASKQFKDAVQALRTRKVAVIGHVRPDGDCIGSQVALTRVLRAQGIEAVAVNAHEVPRNCRAFVQDTPFFLPAEVKDLGERTIVTTDCAGYNRTGEALAAHADRVFLNIDHHISNETFGEHNIVIPEASATAEILAALFLDCGLPIDVATAQALYVGIATDTGQFRFASTTQQVFEICCQLIRHGADPALAARELYENEPFSKIELLQRFLASLRFECGGKVCIGTLDTEAWERTRAGKEDAEGLVDYARAIEGVEIGVLLEDRAGLVKGSLRCKDPVHRVDRIAAQFNGGGHACAAGFNPKMKLDELYPRLVAALETHFANTGAAAVAS